MRSVAFLKPPHHTALILVREGRVTYVEAMPDEDGYRIDGLQPDWYTRSVLADLLAAKLTSRSTAGSTVQVELTDDGRQVAR